MVIEDSERMIGESTRLLEVQEAVSRVAPLNKPVLIVGERGTGKELVAARMHFLSERWQQPFLKVNCAAFSESLLDSELFGHEAGAFSGATHRHKGFFERADGGTLFLDELATTSPQVQEKLLRLIEYGELTRLGGNQVLQVDVRLVAATNDDLPNLAAQGRFRHDLLDRLAFDVITVPPLRERPEDIPLLAEFFAVGMVKDLGLAYFPGFTHEAARSLRDYPWPGNVRELKNVVERAVYRAVDPDAPIDEIVFDPFASPYRPLPDTANESHQPKPDSAPAQPVPAESSPDPLAAFLAGDGDFKSHLQDFEVALLKAAFEHCHHNQRKTAELLGLTYHQLRGYLRKHQFVGS